MEAYRVLKQIGKGSYGQVFLVKHNGSRKQVNGSLALIVCSALTINTILLTFAVCGEENQTDG
jgi:serine/threonine protein kinase